MRMAALNVSRSAAEPRIPGIFRAGEFSRRLRSVPQQRPKIKLRGGADHAGFAEPSDHPQYPITSPCEGVGH
jgi:hypothetical protein